jgi:uncharacterized protein (DUF2384 family)
VLAFFFVFAITNRTHHEGDAMYSEDVEARRGIAQLALKGFFSLANRWQLSRPEAMTLLGLTATSTYANWKNGKTGTIPRDTLERISYLFHIDDRLRQRWTSEQEACTWLRREQNQLGGHSPLSHMLAGNVIDIYRIQQNMSQLLRDSGQAISLPTKSVSNQSPLRTIHSL